MEIVLAIFGFLILTEVIHRNKTPQTDWASRENTEENGYVNRYRKKA